MSYGVASCGRSPVSTVGLDGSETSCVFGATSFGGNGSSKGSFVAGASCGFWG